MLGLPVIVFDPSILLIIQFVISCAADQHKEKLPLV